MRRTRPGTRSGADSILHYRTTGRHVIRFDFDHQRSLNRDVIAHLGSLDFAEARSADSYRFKDRYVGPVPSDDGS